jgi:hypothetical protein
VPASTSSAWSVRLIGGRTRCAPMRRLRPRPRAAVVLPLVLRLVSYGHPPGDDLAAKPGSAFSAASLLERRGAGQGIVSVSVSVPAIRSAMPVSFPDPLSVS